jgi:hypothetical protein
MCPTGEICSSETGLCGPPDCRKYTNTCLIDASADLSQACCSFTGSTENSEPLECNDELEGTIGDNKGKCDITASCGNYAGAPCGDLLPCCSGFTCNQGSCEEQLVKGNCLNVGKCGFDANKCGDAYVCTSGQVCVYQPDTCGVDDGLLDALGLNFIPFNNPITAIDKLLGGITTFMYGGAILLGLLLTIISGYKYMTSEGDPGKIREAQEQLTASVIGIIFVVLSVFILDIIINSLIGGA